MGWRILQITKPCRLSVKNRQLVCENNDEELFKSLYRVVTCGNMLAEKKQALIDAYRPSNKDNLEKIENIIEANIGTSSIE